MSGFGDVSFALLAPDGSVRATAALSSGGTYAGPTVAAEGTGFRVLFYSGSGIEPNLVTATIDADGGFNLGDALEHRVVRQPVPRAHRRLGAAVDGVSHPEHRRR